MKNFIINGKIKKIRRNPEFRNFDTAKNISILYCIKNKGDYDTVKNFVNELSENKNIQTLGFVRKPDEIGNIYLGKNKNHFFSEKHITKLGKIKESCISDFINAKTDILINLCLESIFFTEYVFALSKADFKVSGIPGCKHSDLNINISENKNTDFLIEQITYYLKTIKQG